MASNNPEKSVEPIIIAVEPFGGSIRNHQPQLPLVFFDDAAVTRGDGVFETLLLHGDHACNLERHAKRFVASSRLLDLPEPNLDYWIAATNKALEQWRERTDRDAKCVWTYTRGRASTGIPTAWITVTAISDHVLEQRQHGVKVMTSPRGYTIDRVETTSTDDEGNVVATSSPVAPWLVVGAKTLSYSANMAALRWARGHGYDDVIYMEGDKVLEGATSTVVTVRGDKLRTPIPGGDILPGTTQAALFEHASQHGWRCKAKELRREDLLRADSVWLVSSVRIAARVRRIDDVKLERPDNEDEIRALIMGALGA
ncbi:aminodeoxychorismate lyase [Corynebacterium vitaeruminis]|uniref:aminodeoxychorismate lyase n=1 Tax=Corynebacterium vitaeruminis TaxID=38305 RepID=UPI0023F84317|nr:aminodeoxychorismate lyase [Corynebacterium vitaeruminis]